MKPIFVEPEPSDHALRIRQQLLRLGLSSSRESYRTLCLMVEAALETDEAIPQMKALHACAAARGGKSVSAITRSLSRTMEFLWTRGDREVLTELFGKALTDRPLPHDLILRLRDQIIAEDGEK